MKTHILLVGQVEEEPARRIEDGTLLAIFRLVTRLRYADPLGVDQEHTDYHAIEVAGELASEVGGLAPGTWLRVRGRLAFTFHLDPGDAIEVVVRPERLERLPQPAACVNLVRSTGAVFGAPNLHGREAPVTPFTLLPPRHDGTQALDTWPSAALHGYALGGIAVEVARLPPGAIVTLLGHLRANTRAPIDPTEVPSLALAATAWG